MADSSENAKKPVITIVVPPGFEEQQIPPSKKDPAWKFCKLFSNGPETLIACIFWGNKYNGNITKIKDHPKKIQHVEDEVQKAMLNSSKGKRKLEETDTNITEVVVPNRSKGIRKLKEVDESTSEVGVPIPQAQEKNIENIAEDGFAMALGRFFYDVGVPLDAVNSVFMKPFIDEILKKGSGHVKKKYLGSRSRR